MKKHRRPDIFLSLCGILTVLTVLFIGINVIVMTFQGTRSFLSNVMRTETLFAIGLSVRTACVSTLLCFLLAVPTSFILERTSFPLRPVVETALELTMSLPNIVLGLSMLIIFASPFGKALKHAGFPVVFSQNGIVLAQLIVNLPFAIKLSTAAFRDVDVKLEHVAGLLGASQFRQFSTILLPLSRHTLISALILVWSRALGEFGATLMLVGVTRMKTETLPAGIYLDVSTNDLSGALSSAFMLLLISALSLGIANRLTKKNVRWSRHV